MSGNQSGSTDTGNQSKALLALSLPNPREKKIIEIGVIQIGNTERPSVNYSLDKEEGHILRGNQISDELQPSPFNEKYSANA